MNEADKKALQNWRDEIEVAFPSVERTWQAACEHKQREIDELTFKIAVLEEELEDGVSQT